MLFIDNDVTAKVLRMDDCIRVQTEAFDALARGEAVYRPRLDMYLPCADPEGYYRWGSCEGSSHGVLAVRLKSDIITWPMMPNGKRVEHKHCVRPGMYSGMVFLYSTADGCPLAMMKDGYMQQYRVGGAAGIGTALLSREDSESVSVIGSGGMARTFLTAVCLVRKIKRVTVFSPTQANRDRFAREMSEQLGIEVKPMDSARDAIKGTDIVITATDTMEPVMEGSSVEPGMHLVSLNVREYGDDVFEKIDVAVLQGRERLKMEDTSYFRKDLTSSPGAFFAGTPEERKRVPKAPKGHNRMDQWPLYVDVKNGKAPGRTSPEQVTHYQTWGNWGVQFSSVGALVYRKAKEAGLGQELPQEWFMQDIRN